MPRSEVVSVLLTGHLGYIGSVMAEHLTRLGYRVSGLDSGYFADCTLVPSRVTSRSEASVRTEPPASTSATASRTELLPMSIAA